MTAKAVGLQSMAERCSYLGVIRQCAQDVPVAAGGFLETLQLQTCVSQIILQIEIARVELQGLAVAADSLFGFAVGTQCSAVVVQVISVVRLGRHRQREALQCWCGAIRL